MAEKWTQVMIRRAPDDHPPGNQLYDSEVGGLRVVVGKTSCSYKFVGRINDGTGRYVSVIVGRTDELPYSTRPTMDKTTQRLNEKARLCAGFLIPAAFSAS